MAFGRTKVAISPAFLIFAAMLLLLLPLRWLAAWLTAVAVHEFGHLAVLKAFGIRVNGIRLEFAGARISASQMHYRQELLCALAGPTAGLLLLLLAPWFPRAAVCGGLQSAFNLLPVYPLDGGRALRCGAKLLLPEAWAERICIGLEFCCLVCIVLLAGYGVFVLKLGLLPGIIAVWMVIRGLERKRPCKAWSQALQ